MAIIGFIAVVLLAAYLTFVVVSVGCGVLMLGGSRSDVGVLVVLGIVSTGLWILAGTFAPLRITLN